jgi:hypothetical protein
MITLVVKQKGYMMLVQIKDQGITSKRHGVVGDVGAVTHDYINTNGEFIDKEIAVRLKIFWDISHGRNLDILYGFRIQDYKFVYGDNIPRIWEQICGSSERRHRYEQVRSKTNA